MNKLRSLLTPLLLLPLVAQAATVSYLSGATTTSTAASATYASNAFTPTAGRVLIVVCAASDTLTNPASVSSTVGGDTSRAPRMIAYICSLQTRRRRHPHRR